MADQLERKIRKCQVFVRSQFVTTMILFSIFSAIHDLSSTNSVVHAWTFTDRFCNFTLFPTSGCEESETTTCVNKKCACIDDSYYVVLGRFCVEQLCSNGEFFERNKRRCTRQSRASNELAENHCRYDYHCYGTHVTCKQHGWNYNCVCDAGFRYDSYSETCLPKHGIGGHCIKDFDCDETQLRKMKCDFSSVDNNNNSDQQTSPSGGTCQCIENHRYNYIIDGCEPLADLAYRKGNMKSLVLLFVITGLVLGIVLTCNFNLFTTSPKPNELILQRLRDQERLRKYLSKDHVQQPSSTSSNHKTDNNSIDNKNDGYIKVNMIDQVDGNRKQQSPGKSNKIIITDLDINHHNDDDPEKTNPKSSLI